MIVIILESVPTRVRGLLTRWFLEPRAGVFVGKVSARVRDLVWAEVKRSSTSGSAVLICRTNSEQGFTIVTHGEHRREIVDFDGLQLVRLGD